MKKPTRYQLAKQAKEGEDFLIKKELTEVKNINPRNREEVFFIDLKNGEILNQNLEKVGKARINKRTQVLTIRTSYEEKIKLGKREIKTILK